MFVLAAAISGLSAAAWLYLLLRPDRHADIVAAYGLDPLGPPILMTIVGAAICAIARPRRGFLAVGGVFAAVLLIVSFWLNPQLNDARAGESFVARIEQAADPQHELGLVAFKEQYVLHARRPLVHFGHARWREGVQEMADAALWLSARPGRQLVINDEARAACFSNAPALSLGNANRTGWYLVREGANPSCVARGKRHAEHHYLPPAGTRLSS